MPFIICFLRVKKIIVTGTLRPRPFCVVFYPLQNNSILILYWPKISSIGGFGVTFREIECNFNFNYFFFN